MPLAYLVNTPHTPQEWDIWSWSHQDQHDIVRQAIRAKYGIDLFQYVLWPIPFQDLNQWLDANQQAHDDNNGVLGTQGSNLQQTNFNDPNQLQAWIWLHRKEHENWAQALGVS